MAVPPQQIGVDQSTGLPAGTPLDMDFRTPEFARFLRNYPDFAFARLEYEVTKVNRFSHAQRRLLVLTGRGVENIKKDFIVTKFHTYQQVSAVVARGPSELLIAFTTGSRFKLKVVGALTIAHELRNRVAASCSTGAVNGLATFTEPVPALEESPVPPPVSEAQMAAFLQEFEATTGGEGSGAMPLGKAAEAPVQRRARSGPVVTDLTDAVDGAGSFVPADIRFFSSAPSSPDEPLADSVGAVSVPDEADITCQVAMEASFGVQSQTSDRNATYLSRITGVSDEERVRLAADAVVLDMDTKVGRGVLNFVTSCFARSGAALLQRGASSGSQAAHAVPLSQELAFSPASIYASNIERSKAFPRLDSSLLDVEKYPSFADAAQHVRRFTDAMRGHILTCGEHASRFAQHLPDTGDVGAERVFEGMELVKAAVVDSLERSILGRALASPLLIRAVFDTRRRDSAFRDAVHKLAELTPAALGVREDLVPAGYFAESIGVLQLLSIGRAEAATPTVLANIVRLALSAADRDVRASSRKALEAREKSKTLDPLAMDELVPIAVYCVVTARPQCPFALRQYLESIGFLGLGALSFAVTTFSAALAQVLREAQTFEQRPVVCIAVPHGVSVSDSDRDDMATVLDERGLKNSVVLLRRFRSASMSMTSGPTPLVARATIYESDLRGSRRLNVVRACRNFMGRLMHASPLAIDVRVASRDTFGSLFR